MRRLLRHAPMVARQLWRSPRRTALTFAGLAIAFFLFTSLESLLYTMGSVIRATAGDSLLFVRPAERTARWLPELPSRYAPVVERLPGVDAAAPVRLHFGRGRHEGQLAVALGIRPEDHQKLGLPKGVTAAELEALLGEREAALVGESLLADNDWKVGDRVAIWNRLGQTLAFTIRGDIAEDDRLGRAALVRLDYMESALGGAGRVTFLQVKARDASLAPALADLIDRNFAHFNTPTETVTEKAHVAPFVASLSDAMNGLRAIGYLALAVTLLVVANSVAIGVRERTREIGALRALGYGRGRVVGMVLAESIAVSALGGLVGAAAAYALFRAGGFEVPGVGFELSTDASVLARSAALAVVLGALAGAQPAWSAVRMTITDALRYSD